MEASAFNIRNVSFFPGEFSIVTILFSDIVSFTNICAECRPIDIVNMLNALYVRFDKLTSVHDVYKVRAQK